MSENIFHRYNTNYLVEPELPPLEPESPPPLPPQPEPQPQQIVPNSEENIMMESQQIVPNSEENMIVSITPVIVIFHQNNTTMFAYQIQSPNGLNVLLFTH